MGYISLYLLVGLGVSLGIVSLLPRRVCLILGGVALVLGIVLPIGIWTYANSFVQGDKSAYGMLGTILVILFAPSGLAIMLLSLLKND